MEELNSNEQKSINQATINALYKSLAAGDTKIVSSLLATDLEWWFHGPQNCHHMMRMLTGEAPHTEFRFEPRSVTTDDHIVIVEGYEGADVYWVHVRRVLGTRLATERWVDNPVQGVFQHVANCEEIEGETRWGPAWLGRQGQLVYLVEEPTSRSFSAIVARTHACHLRICSIKH